jgi:hypothetical protein
VPKIVLNPSNALSSGLITSTGATPQQNAGIVPASAGNLVTGLNSFRANASNWALPTSNPQILLTFQGTQSGDYLAQEGEPLVLTELNGVLTYQFPYTYVDWYGFTWTQTFNTTTGAISPPLTVVSATATVLTVNSSPATAGFASSGYIQVFHDGIPPVPCVYSYTGIVGNTFIGCALQSFTLSEFFGYVSSAIPVSSLAPDDQVVQYWRPPPNSQITQAYFQMQVGLTTPSFLATPASVGGPVSTIQAIFPGPNPIPTVTTSTPTSVYTQLSTSPPMGTTNPGLYASVASVPQAITGWIFQPPLVGIEPMTIPDYGAWSIMTFGMGPISTAEERVASVGLVITYTLPPTVTPSLPGIIDSSFVSNTTPQVTWVYGDPGGQPQASYRIVIFNHADAVNVNFNINDPSNYLPCEAGYMVGTQTWGSSAPTPVYDSGDQFSSVTSAIIPGGFLTRGARYRIFVLVTHAPGSGTPYPFMTNSGSLTGVAGSLNAGIDFTVGTEPILMPSLSFPSTASAPSSSFNPAVAAIGPIAVRARQNLLSAGDADFGLTGGTPGWSIDSALSSGTGTIPTLSYGTANSYFGEQMTVSTYGTTTATVAIASSLTACAQGEMITAGVKAFNNNTGIATTAEIRMQFYSDTAGLVPLAILNPNYPSCPVPISTTTAQSNPGMFFVQGKVPVGALTCQLIVVFTTSTSTVSAGWLSVFQPFITSNCINLLDDAFFANGVLGNTALVGLANQAPTGAGWMAEPKGANASPTIVTDTGPSYIAGTTAVDIPITDSASTTSVHTAYLIPLFNNDTNPFLMGCDTKMVTPFASFPQTILGIISTAGAAADASALTIIDNNWHHYATSITSNLSGAYGYFGVVIGTASGTTGDVHFSNFQLERVWTFTDGTFEKFTAPQSIPLTTTLGDYGASTSLVSAGNSYGQWWQVVSLPAGCSAAVTTANPHSGSNSLALTTSPTDLGPVTVEQYFTVSGWTSLTASWYWAAVTATLSGYVEFFDSAGTLLSAVSIPGTISSQAGLSTLSSSSLPTSTTFGTGTFGAGVFGGNSSSLTFTQATPGSIVVPATAAYAHIVFSMMGTQPGYSGTGYIDDVVIAGTGSLLPSSPWLDGGWSQGGLAQSSPTVSLQRGSSLSLVETFGELVRTGAETAAAVPVSTPTFEADFFDREFPTTTAGSVEVIYYESLAVNGSSQSPPNVVAISNSNGFSPSVWTLSDVLQGVTITLQVVDKVDITTSENQTILMPMGRGRKVVLGDSLIFGDTITLPLQTLNNADFVALQTLYSVTYPLVLRSPDGEWWYVRATTRSRTRKWQGSYARPLRTYSLVFEEVDVIP